VLFFSSLQSFSRNPGQSNYAAGCTFQDAYAQALGQSWTCPVKVMNWGYWGSVGVVASAQYRERMARLGLGSIEPPEGMKALETLLGSSRNQLALAKLTKPLETLFASLTAPDKLTIAPRTMPSIIARLTPPSLKFTTALYEKNYDFGSGVREAAQ
jgi:polyketide synthase PksM